MHHTKITVPVAPLKMIVMENCRELGEAVNRHLCEIRGQKDENDPILSMEGFLDSTYLVPHNLTRFGTGEAKASVLHSVRGTDLYILADLVNPDINFKMHRGETQKSPDDHFQDLKRLIAACGGHPHRITVIMPFLYEGRQHKKDKLESLDCAIALQELASMGVENFITFDAHDPRVQNAIPIKSFENFFTSLQFIQALVKTEPELKIDQENLMVISPDEGGMSRSVYYANVLGVDMGMFYKRRDYSVIENGKNPIVAHEFLGNDVSGKSVFIIDDMISSGESILDVAHEMKKRNAARVYIATTFGLFTEGIEKFDEAFENGLIDRIFTTNLTYCPPELLKRPYYKQVDLSRYVAAIIDTLNIDASVSEIMDPSDRIKALLEEHNKRALNP